MRLNFLLGLLILVLSSSVLGSSYSKKAYYFKHHKSQKHYCSGKPLFSYPSDIRPSYVTTYTREDWLRDQQQKFEEDLQKASYRRQMARPKPTDI